MLRTCYKSKMRLWADSVELTPGRWFRAPASAKMFEGPHRITSAWWRDPHPPDPEVGEVWEPRLRYDTGENTLGYTGREVCGSLQAVRTGGVHGRDPEILTLANGSTPCCFGGPPPPPPPPPPDPPFPPWTGGPALCGADNFDFDLFALAPLADDWTFVALFSFTADPSYDIGLPGYTRFLHENPIFPYWVSVFGRRRLPGDPAIVHSTGGVGAFKLGVSWWAPAVSGPPVCGPVATGSGVLMAAVGAASAGPTWSFQFVGTFGPSTITPNAPATTFAFQFPTPGHTVHMTRQVAGAGPGVAMSCVHGDAQDWVSVVIALS